MKKMLSMIFLAVLIAGMCVTTVRAEQQPTQQYNKIFLNPFYVENLVANQVYNYSVVVNPPDKVSSIANAIISFNAQINGQSQNFTLLVNNQSCMPSNYYIATAFSTTGNVQFFFDCSNRINSSKTYNITLKSAVNTGAISSWLDLTYQNNPKGTLDLFGTEYYTEQQGKLWLQLLDANRSYITSGVCYLDVYTPSNTQYLEGAVMTNMFHDGVYYYDFNPVPATEGVYPAIARCYYSVGTTYNFGTTIQMINGTLDGGSLTNTQVLDGSYMLTTESPAGVNPRRYWAEINFSNGGICNISEALLSGITFDWTGRWSSNVGTDDITISVWNYTSSTWVNLTNKISGGGSGVKTVSNSLVTTNLTKAGLVNSTGTNLRLKFLDTNATDTTSTGLDYDYLSVGCVQLLSPVYEEVRGSSEMHISNPATWNITTNINETSISTTIWNYSNRSLTTPDVDINTTQIANAIWNYSGTIHPNILSQFASSVWSIFNSTYNFINLITESIWTRTNRNLTYYPDVTNYTLINEGVWNSPVRNLTYYPDVNYTAISDAVWTNLNRSLTEFNFDVVNETEISNAVWSNINRTLTDYPALNETQVADAVWNSVSRNLTYYEVNNLSAQDVWNYASRNLTYEQVNNLSAQDVWEYTTRELTYYPAINFTLENVTTNDIAEAVWNYNGTVSNNILSQFSEKVLCVVQNLLNQRNEDWGVDISVC